MDLKTYISTSRGMAASLAREIKVTPVLISQWASVRQVPIPHCPAIEQATGGKVTRRDLRPDDWERIWPELV